MRNYTFSVLLKSAWLAGLLLMLACRLSAQSDIRIGNDTSGNSSTGYPCPLQDYYEGNRAQYLILASELRAAGMNTGVISGIRFFVKNLNGADTLEQYAIKIGSTTATTLDANSWLSGTTKVYGPIDYGLKAGNNSFSFSTPFFWNGTDNIVVEVCDGSPNSTNGDYYTYNAEVPYTTGLSFNASHTYRADNQDNLCGTASTTNYGTMTTRPNMVLVWTAAAACTGTPTPGTASANMTTVCLNAPFTASLTGTTLASALSYQWQRSTDNVTWTNMPNDTANQMTSTQSVTSYYRCKVTCRTSGASAFSNSVSVASPALISGTFTINKALPAGSGNFKSFNDAYSSIKCGINGPVTFNVVAGSGPYNEQLLLQPVPGASATNTITFNGNGDTLMFNCTSTNRAVIKMDDADYFTFKNLVIKPLGAGSSGYGWGVHLINAADYNSIVNCKILLDSTSTASNYAGIVISSSTTSPTSTGDAKCNFNTFGGNTINGGYYGVVMAGSINVANGNNKIINNNITNFYNYGIYINGSFNTLIENNRISRPTRASTSTFYGIYLTSLSTKANITRNRIFNPFGGNPGSNSGAYGIYFTSTRALSQLENVVSNNLIYNFTGKGDAYGIYNSSSDNVRYYHNTIAVDGVGSSSAAYTARGFYQTSKADGIEFLNNLIAVTRDGGGSKYAIYLGTTTSTIHSNFNDLYVASATGSNYTGYYNSNMASLLDFQTAAKQDTNSVASNPLFVSIASGNYQPTNASIDNKGTPVGITTDINNAVRSTTTPDIGAYEFTPDPCVTPPTPGNAHVNITPVCVNRKVALTLADNSIGLGQTYQWQWSSTATGTYTNIGGVLTNPDTAITATDTRYYRVAVTCSGNTAYSAPVLLSVTPAFPGGTYTINKGAPASGTNFVSFNAAKAAMECGIAGPVVFNVAAASGPYTEQLTLDSIAGTSVINTITFNGNGNTIKFAPADGNERAVIKLRSADHVTFDSLTIDATGGSYGYGVQLWNNADSNTISRCNILINATSSYSDYNGIVVNGGDASATTSTANLCDGNVFRGNSITGGYYGIIIYANGNSPVTGNRILNNRILDFYAKGIDINNTINTVVDHNDISRPTRNNESYYLYGIEIEGKGSGVVASNNRIHNLYGGHLTSTSSTYGLEFSYASATAAAPARVFNNVIYDIRSASYIYGLSNYSSAYVQYAHNTIVLDDSKNTSNSNTAGFSQSGNAPGITFYDNIVAVSRAGNGDRTGLALSTNSTIISDYNDIFVKSANNRAYTGRLGVNAVTLANWRAATKLDSNSIAVEPVFADPANGNYAPVISPLHHTGRPAGVATDILGVSRSATTPDMGAYEVDIPMCTKPVIPGTATVSPNTPVCMDSQITLDLTGNSKGGTQTYTWQRAVSVNGPWDNAGEAQYVSLFYTTLGAKKYYRCMVICGGTDTAYSAVVMANQNPPLLAGTYTINPALPPSTTNFQSFTSVVAKLECGIAGAVTFLAANGTYNEQITMHHIPGASDTSRVTFRSASDTASAVTLAWEGSSAANYVLLLDSVDYVTWRTITFQPLDTVYATGVVFNKGASYDSVINCAVKMPATLRTGANMSGVYASTLTGVKNVVKGNTILNGTNGIYMNGSFNQSVRAMVLDSNTITGPHDYGIYAYYATRPFLNKNNISLSGDLATTAYGIYLSNCDSLFTLTRNKVKASNTSSKVEGIYLYYVGAQGQKGLVNGNEVYLRGGLSGNLNGLHIYQVSFAWVINNVISVQTSDSDAYGLYSESSNNINYYNNSVLNSATGTGSNYAAYFSHTYSGYGNIKIRNNIFASDTSGRAMYIAMPDYLKSDYNTLYTKGTVLVSQNAGPAGDFATLQEYRDADTLDINSIVYKPAFVSASDLHPDIAAPDVWAIHGRGVQIEENNKDLNGDSRPTTLKAGVPDMGAYEFLPTSVPPVLPAFPATPAPGVTQRFMFGTDTVSKITWNPGATVPSNIQVRRYSGVKPPNLATGTDFMYFYVAMDATPSSATYNFNIQQFYVNSWQGYIKRQRDIRLARTDSVNTWHIDSTSKVNEITKVITDSTLHYLNKFTGLNGGDNSRQLLQPSDSSNRGTRFWVGYGHHQFFAQDNSQNMVLYLNAQDSANVTVRINGTTWERTYHIPAHTTITTEIMPKTGLNDARLTEEGLSDKGISIESDIPIVAYAHIYGSASSGATMLLPVGTYGYDYSTLGSRQYYGSSNCYSWFYVMAEYDDTKVEITPSVPTLGGKPANVPFTVTLNKGEVYQVLGAMQPDGNEGYDISGSHVRSILNDAGKCYPMAVFSGSSRTALGCGGSLGSSGDNAIQQNFPSQAWGRKYLTAPTSNSTAANSLMTNIYRVLVKDPSVPVKKNGRPLTGLINNRFYQYESNTGDVIESDAPVMVAQFMSSSGDCPGTNGLGDPEMIYLSPIEQGIKSVGLYRTTLEAITLNYLTLIVPTGGVSSLRIDGSNTFDYSYPHPNANGYTIVVKRWTAARAQCNVSCDSAFTATTYGLGSVESYGYNAGTLVKNLNILPSFNNVLNTTGSANTYTCAKTPFRFSLMIQVKPVTLTWKFSEVADLTPKTDVVQNNPVPVDSVVVNRRTYYRFELKADYTFAKPGMYYVPIRITHPDIESCSNSFESILPVKVIPAPVVDYTVSYSGCLNDQATFKGSANTSNGAGIHSWRWDFSDTTYSSAKDTVKTFHRSGIHNVKLGIIAAEGCIGDTTKAVEVYNPATAALVKDSMTVCNGSDVVFTVKDPQPGVLYNWYDAANGGNLLHTGNDYTIAAITASGTYYVEAIMHGCRGLARAKAVVHVLPVLVKPVVTVDSAGVNLIRFKWSPVPNATGYEVSIDGGLNWTAPSGGRETLEHVVTGLQPVQSVKLLVKAKGCEDKISDPAEGKTLPDGIYIPNTFTPNNDGKNDVLLVYGYIIQQMHIAIFDQWGEKVFESNNQQRGWDGTYKGKALPSGVYIYVCHITLRDGSTVEKKGVINLIR